MPLFHLVSPLIGLAESGHLPDAVVRAGIRSLLRARLRDMRRTSDVERADAIIALRNALSGGPVAAVPELANDQHYEVPAALYQHVLGPHLKYSSCHWDTADTLAEAEAKALQLTCEHAGVQDGQTILELGCGWGSLTLWMAEHCPGSRITAVSNSASQRAFILQRAADRGLKNISVHTCDINTFQADDAAFDRVVSVEMFEHVRNHSLLMRRISKWLKPDGKLFVHIFCHRDTPYLFENDGPAAWMARTFFSGGMMPSGDWLEGCEHPLQLNQEWQWNGRHYERTCNEWLRNMDASTAVLEPILRDAYGAEWKIWRQRWRMFFMACAELFGFHNGEEWFVGHYLFDNGS